MPISIGMHNANCTTERLKGLLDYALKIATTWVACKKLHTRIARPFTLRIQHRAIFLKCFSYCVPICDCASKI